MNKVILMGRLTRDPDIRYSQGENSRSIARYTLAVDRRRANADGQREADFIGCVAFDRQAEFAERYLHQGSKIAIAGRIQTGSYTNRDGQKVYTTDVIIEEQEFAESKQQGQRQASQGGYGQSQGYQNKQPYVAPEAPQERYDQQEFPDGFYNIPEGLDDSGLPWNGGE